MRLMDVLTEENDAVSIEVIQQIAPVNKHADANAYAEVDNSRTDKDNKGKDGVNSVFLQSETPLQLPPLVKFGCTCTRSTSNATTPLPSLCSRTAAHTT